MDKTLLKNFAIYSREKLLSEVKSKASMLGIREEGINPPLAESTPDMYAFDIKAVESFKIYNGEIKKYQRLVKEIQKREELEDYKTAYNSLLEEVAYTWFNRLIAIRFMEVNNYLPGKMRVLSSGRGGVNEPEIVTNYLDSNLDLTEKELENLWQWKMDASNLSMEKTFQLLFIKECNRLNLNLPELFEKTDDYIDLLLTISYNDPDGVLYKLVHEIPEEYFDVESEDSGGQVEIIGWMYQYYNTEKKDEVFSRPKSEKISKEDVPAATQLFTPDWIVRYMVENSLGRIWIDKLILNGDKRDEKEIAEEFNWKYYIPQAQQREEVKESFIETNLKNIDLKLEDIRFIDPAMGSFHIGVYAFDIFMQVYLSQGYTARDAAKSIIENNLYGIDIDKRAYQLSYFACMMKARKYNRRILNERTKTNLYTIVESNKINRGHLNFLGGKVEEIKTWNKTRKEIMEILDIFLDAREYGSILEISDSYDFERLKGFILNLKESAQVSFETIGIEDSQREILNLLNLAEVISQTYHIVITNPPYMGSGGMTKKLNSYVKKNYPNSKLDLFAIFIERCRDFTKNNGYYSMITQHSWMFLSSYEKLRMDLQKNTIINMVHLGTRAFEEIGGEVVQTTAFTIKKADINNYRGRYIRLVKFNNAKEKEIKALESLKDSNCKYSYEIQQDNFEKVPGNPIAYWLSYKIYDIYKTGQLFGDLANPKVGMQTSNNDKYLRVWHEIDYSEFKGSSLGKKWIKYLKGGMYRKWYGNLEYLLFYNYKPEFIQQQKNARVLHEEFLEKPKCTWTDLTTGNNSFRFAPKDTFYDISGHCFFPSEEDQYWLLGYTNTIIFTSLIKVFNSTLHCQVGDVSRVVVPNISDRDKEAVTRLAKENVELSKIDWDGFETSWDFKTHPLLEIGASNSIEESYKKLKDLVNGRFERLKENEKAINDIFIGIYDLEDQMDPIVSDKDISVSKIFDHKSEIYDEIRGNRYILTKEDIIKSLISYGIGCIFGRYSLDSDGLAYGGGSWDDDKYSSFLPAKDNIVLITDEEYFEDDLVNRFIEFVKIAFGEKNLEENLRFIAENLGRGQAPKDAFRNYFLKDFYKDHLRRYKRRPIYWLYDSGREDGFKALVYMHRYDENTTGKLRIDYLHKLQKVYERTIEDIKSDISTGENAREIAGGEKSLKKITKQLKECKDYDEKIGHLAIDRIDINLDDGVKVNHKKIQKDDRGNDLAILAEI